MPAPEHLLPILDKLGDGGTVALAETVHQMLADARSEAAAAAVPPDAAALQAERDHLESEIGGLASVLIDEFGGPTAADVNHGACGMAARVLREQAAELKQIKAAVIELAPAPVMLTAAEAERITRTGSNTTGATTATVDIHALIEASSLGDPHAVAARASVPLEQGQELAARAAALTPADLDDGPAAQAADADVIDWDDDPDQIGDGARAHAAGPDSGQQALPGPLRAEWDEVAAMLAAGQLTDAEADELRADITARAKATEAAATPTNAEVRAWCEANKVPVNARGAVRADARAAYDAAHQGPTR